MLANKWNVWYDRPGKKQPRGDFNTSMKHIYQFDSVKAFWGLYNHLDLREMPVGANIRIFKHDIQPTWEDPQNRQGGNWILVPKNQDGQVSQVFKELLLALIGGDLAKHVNGIVMSKKAKDVIIQIWIKKKEKRDSVKRTVLTALEAYWKTDPDARKNFEKNDVWTWRAHPTASLSMKEPCAQGHMHMQEDTSQCHMLMQAQRIDRHRPHTGSEGPKGTGSTHT